MMNSKLYIILWVLLVPCASAQSASDSAAALQQLQRDLPACALTCAGIEVPRSACNATDLVCQCANTDLSTALTACVSTNCTVVELLATHKAISTACGVPVRNISHHVVNAMWPLYSMAVLAVVMRMAGKLPTSVRQYSWDDYFMVLCLFSLTALCAIAQVLANKGLGQDIWMLSPGQIQDTLFYFWIAQFVYSLPVCLTKISILLLYSRLFGSTSLAFQRQCWTVIVITALFGIASIVTTGCLCSPIDHLWEGWEGTQTAKCVNINTLTWAVSGINIVLDVVIIVLPLFQLWGLQMHWKKKLAVASMFMVGLFVTICSIVRLRTILKFHLTTNPTYDYTELAVWSVIEPCAGVVCACMPGLANCLRRFWPKFLTTRDSRSSRPTNGATHSLRSGSKYGKMGSLSKKIQSKTTVSITYTERCHVADNTSSRSDELELTPPTGYRQHDSGAARCSRESSIEGRSHNEDRKYGYHG